MRTPGRHCGLNVIYRTFEASSTKFDGILELLALYGTLLLVGKPRLVTDSAGGPPDDVDPRQDEPRSCVLGSLATMYQNSGMHHTTITMIILEYRRASSTDARGNPHWVGRMNVLF